MQPTKILWQGTASFGGNSLHIDYMDLPKRAFDRRAFGKNILRKGCTFQFEKFWDWGLRFARNLQMSRFGTINNFPFCFPCKHWSETTFIFNLRTFLHRIYMIQQAQNFYFVNKNSISLPNDYPHRLCNLKNLKDNCGAHVRDITKC